MTSIPSSVFTTTLLDLLQETFEGTGGQGSSFIDGRGHGSLFETLDGLNAEAASTPLKPGGATIAGHAEHIRYYLWAIQGFMRNLPDHKPDWKASWRVHTVTEPQWRELRQALRDEYAGAVQYFQLPADWENDEEAVSGRLSILAHSAYHLGAIRLLTVTLK